LAAELRWVLLGLSLPLLAAIWWWTARRTRQAPGDAALRESTAKSAEIVPTLDPQYAGYDDGDIKEAQPRDWGVPPFEPLNIRTADFDNVPVLDGPMMVSAAPVPPPAETAAATATATAAATVAPTLTPPSGNAELQRIVTIRVCTVGDARWSGSQLMGALESHGLAFGRYQVFHRKHTDGRSLFCVASLIEPGTFDIAAMPDQEFRGVTLFAVLPGPVEPLDTMNELFGTARGLAEALAGMVQDGKGMPLSPQRAAALREEIARFQASLPRS
jgi:cell division protein ZipA